MRKESSMWCKRVLGIVLAIIMVLPVVALGASASEDNNSWPNIHGVAWAGFEWQNKINGWYTGFEVYRPDFLSISGLALEAKVDYSFYSRDESSLIGGLRGIFSWCSLGVGSGVNFYGTKTPHYKEYFWASFYGDDYYAKAYFDMTFDNNFGKVSIEASYKPWGLSFNYMLNVTPPTGEYSDLRVAVSCSWGYLGGKITYFSQQNTGYRADWKGLFVGLTPINGSLGKTSFELQVLDKQDKYGKSLDIRLIVSGLLFF